MTEDLLQEGYDFVLTAKFQSDPIEKRFGQYRQMSGGRFLISAKDVICSEKNVRIESLVQEGFIIDDKIMLEEDHSSGLQDLLYSLSEAIEDRDSITLAEKSRDVSDSIAGYIAHKSNIVTDAAENILLIKVIRHSIIIISANFHVVDF